LNRQSTQAMTSTFSPHKKRRQPTLSTSSLPDIVFILLFFFMVSTIIRENEVLLEVELPSVSETTQLKRQSLVDYIYVGSATAADENLPPLLQLNDALSEVSDIVPWVHNKRPEISDVDRSRLFTSLKVDKEVKMGWVNQIKLELRKAQALKISYSAQKTVSSID